MSLTFIVQATRYFGLDKEILGRFFEVKWSLILHIVGGILALLIGPVQFSNRIRTKYTKWHRNMGKIYLAAILISSISSTILAWTAALSIHWTWAFSLQILGFVWGTSVFMGYISIRKRRVQQHKQWMIRSYIITIAFVSFVTLERLQ
mgnify:CR=1 FL=1